MATTKGQKERKFHAPEIQDSSSYIESHWQFLDKAMPVTVVLTELRQPRAMSQRVSDPWVLKSISSRGLKLLDMTTTLPGCGRSTAQNQKSTTEHL